MCYLKLWSILLPIVLLTSDYKKLANAGQRDILSQRTLFGGFVGCIRQDVCLEEEVCVDDNLFGKCLNPEATRFTEPTHLSTQKFRRLEKIIKNKVPSGIDWRDLHTQCIVRSILHFNEALTIEKAEALCNSFWNEETEGPEEIAFDETNTYSQRKKENFGDLRLKRGAVRKREQIFGKGEIEPFVPTRNYPDLRSDVYSHLRWLASSNKGQKEEFQIRQRLRSEFDKELRRIITQLRAKNYAYRNFKEEVYEQPKEKWNSGNVSDGPFKTDEMRRLGEHDEKPLKRRYQLYLPDDLQPLPQRTRSWVWIKFYHRSLNTYEAEQFLKELFYRLNLASPIPSFHLDKTGNVLYFQVSATTGTTAEEVAQALRDGKGNFEGFFVEQVGFGRGTPLQIAVEEVKPPKKYAVTLVICLSILSFVFILLLAYCIQLCHRKFQSRRKSSCTQKDALIEVERQSSKPRRFPALLKNIHQAFEQNLHPEKIKEQRSTSHPVTSCYQPPTEKTFSQPSFNPSDYRHSKETIATDVSTVSETKRKSPVEHKDSLTSQGSSSQSWSSEPVSSAIDVTTGHLILSYMEAYLREDSRMTADWDTVNAYEAEEATPCVSAQRPENLMKNRLTAPLPYEQSRVRLRFSKNDYINASLIYDHSPRNPVYIATPTPLLDTLADFWQMIWEQNSVVIVCLERPADLKPFTDQPILDNDDLTDECVRYWPNEGARAYGNFEAHLVSEHSSSDKYIVRSFYLKNLQTGETRTVTQFHYLTWNDEKLKSETKSLLDFRRKVNRSFRGMMSPIVVHCSDGSSRTGTYMLLDLVLNRITKGVKEVNIAATLEHLRDQRQGMVRRKEQYEFVFTAVAHEVDMMLKMGHQSG